MVFEIELKKEEEFKYQLCKLSENGICCKYKCSCKGEESERDDCPDWYLASVILSLQDGLISISDKL